MLCRFAIAFIAIALFVVPTAPAFAESAAPQAAATPLRHLVYAFHYASDSNVEEHNSGFNGSYGNGVGTGGNPGGSSGISNYTQSNGDQGTIVVDVQREQPDRGLVLSVREHARGTRTAKPITCVVYGTGSFICDPNGTLHLEEASVIRFLGENFVDPALIGPKGNWSFQSHSATYNADSTYGIIKHAGSTLTIDEQRSLDMTERGRKSAVVTSTLTYDVAKSVPLSIQEVTMDRADQGMSHFSSTRIEVDATLTADSMGAVAATH